MSQALTPGQAKFASAFARATGLNARVVGAWLYAEQNGSAARGYEGRGYNNWLNIANTDSGPAGGAHSNVWRNPETAALASAEWMRGRGRIAHEYGAPAQGIREILHAAGRSPDQQIAAIAKSPWASSHYNGGSTLRSTYQTVGGAAFPSGPSEPAAVPKPAGVAPTLPGVTVPTENFDKPGFEKAQKAAVLGKLLASEKGSKENPLFATGLVTTKEPSRSEYMTEGTRTLPGTPSPPQAPQRVPAAPSGGSKLGGFLPGNAKLQMSRIDQGQDIATNPGGPIIAPGDGVVIAVKDNPGGFGERYPVVRFTSGPMAGQTVYIGHTHSDLPVGAHFKTGQPLSHTGYGTPKEGNARTPGWAEIGFWGPGGPGNMEAGKKIAPFLRRK